MIPLLKKLNFLDQSSIPTDVYKKYRDDTISKEILAEQVKEAYSDIFMTHEYAYKLDKVELTKKLTTLIGVEEGDNKKFQPLGMKKSDFNSFSHDHVSDKIKEYSDPVIKFKLLADTIEMEGEERSFVVIQVLGSSDITICTKSEKWNMDIDFLPRNMALRKNAVYIRSETPVSSREINSAQEWRELIDGIVQKNKQDLLKKLPCSGIHKDIEPSDDKKFNKDLKDDDL